MDGMPLISGCDAVRSITEVPRQQAVARFNCLQLPTAQYPRELNLLRALFSVRNFVERETRELRERLPRFHHQQTSLRRHRTCSQPVLELPNDTLDKRKSITGTPWLSLLQLPRRLDLCTLPWRPRALRTRRQHPLYPAVLASLAPPLRAS